MKKTISIILSVILLISIAAISCFAKDSDEWKNNTGEINLTAMTVSGGGAEIKDNVISIVRGGDFSVTGTLADGMIYVNTEEKVKLRLNGVSVTNSAGPAIFFDNAEKGFITITENTENYLTDGAEYTTEGADAVIFSNDDLEIKGSGTLNITANYKHGIASDDDAVIENGTINITANEHGIKANDTLSVLDGSIDITAKTGKGMKAGKEIIIDGGAININSEQSEGIESKGILTINGGDINITAADDGINTGTESSETDADSQMMSVQPTNSETPQGGRHPQMNNGEMPETPQGGRPLQMANGEIPEAPQGGRHPQMNNGEMSEAPQGGRPPQMTNGEMPEAPQGEKTKNAGFNGDMGRIDAETASAHSITINGGNIYIKAIGDGIDSNGNLIINGGRIIVDGPISGGDGPLDSEGVMSINGGVVFTASSAGMLQLPANSDSQNILKFILSEKQSTGAKVSIMETENGKETELISYTPKTDYQAIIFSSQEIESGKEYAIYINDEKYKTVTAVDGTTSAGNSFGGFGGIDRGTKGDNRFENRYSKDEIKVTVNGSKINFDTAPVIKNDTTLVGFRAIFEALGADVEWDNDTQAVTAKKDGITIILQIGSKTAYVNGEEKELLLEPEIINDSAMIPVRFISEQLGMNVTWIEESQLIEINYN